MFRAGITRSGRSFLKSMRRWPRRILWKSWRRLGCLISWRGTTWSFSRTGRLHTSPNPPADTWSLDPTEPRDFPRPQPGGEPVYKVREQANTDAGTIEDGGEQGMEESSYLITLSEPMTNRMTCCEKQRKHNQLLIKDWDIAMLFSFPTIYELISGQFWYFSYNCVKHQKMQKTEVKIPKY